MSLFVNAVTLLGVVQFQIKRIKEWWNTLEAREEGVSATQVNVNVNCSYWAGSEEQS